MASALPARKKSSFHYSSATYISCTAALILIAFFYGWYPGFTQESQSALGWLRTVWTPGADYEHGWLVPLFALYMFYHAWKRMKGIPRQPSLWGLLAVGLGGGLFLLSVRTLQGRIAIASLPFIFCGLIWCYQGWKAAWRCAFPCFFLWLAIPVPGLQQATVGMQLIASHAAHAMADCCGVETILEGTNISSPDGHWDAFDIAGGCSGMRSLMALIMISCAWGYLAYRLSLWKRILLAFSAIPISIIANAFRVGSIFICAEYIDPSFAGKTWHDWSGLVLFFPASLLCLALLHSLLAGELPGFSKRKVIRRRQSDGSQSDGNHGNGNRRGDAEPVLPAEAMTAQQAASAPCEASVQKPAAPFIVLLPPIVLGAILSLVWCIPHEVNLRESAISPDLPLGYSLFGWYGIRTQETEKERQVLADDTRFSKGIYQAMNMITMEPEGPQVTVSIVYSGDDMNSSIHRPERCLPAQGHRNLRATSLKLTLEDGRQLPFTRLVSTVTSKQNGQDVDYEYIHYYVFVGSSYICASHYERTLRDILDRVLGGYTQRWAYFQVGAAYKRGNSAAAKEIDSAVRSLISRLLPRLVNKTMERN